MSISGEANQFIILSLVLLSCFNDWAWAYITVHPLEVGVMNFEHFTLQITQWVRRHSPLYTAIPCVQPFPSSRVTDGVPDS